MKLRKQQRADEEAERIRFVFLCLWWQVIKQIDTVITFNLMDPRSL